MAKAEKTTVIPDVITIGNRQFKKSMPKPEKLPDYPFPAGFFAEEKKEKAEKQG